MRKVFGIIVFSTFFGSSGTGFLSQLKNKPEIVEYFIMANTNDFGLLF